MKFYIYFSRAYFWFVLDTVTKQNTISKIRNLYQIYIYRYWIQSDISDF